MKTARNSHLYYQIGEKTMEPKSTIIIIEDEKNICSFIETILEAHGYVTSTATNGNDGIALIASTKPSVVLLDLGLPV